MVESYQQGRRWRLGLRGLLLVTLTLGLAHGESKVAPDFNPKAGSTADVIVQFRHAPSGTHHQKIRAQGGTLRQELRPAHAAAYTLPAEAVSMLAADPEVVYISPD